MRNALPGLPTLEGDTRREALALLRGAALGLAVGLVLAVVQGCGSDAVGEEVGIEIRSRASTSSTPTPTPTPTN